MRDFILSLSTLDENLKYAFQEEEKCYRLETWVSIKENTILKKQIIVIDILIFLTLLI